MQELERYIDYVSVFLYGCSLSLTCCHLLITHLTLNTAKAVGNVISSAGIKL